MKSRTILLSLILFVSVHLSYATRFDNDLFHGTVSGKVSDATTGMPMEYANISLFDQNDSSLVNGTITTVDGDFIIEKIPFGQYYIEVSFIGFEKNIVKNIKLSKEKRNISLGKIVLSPSASQLDDVQVTAEKSRVEYKIDKRVINVTKEVIAAGGNAVQVLENTPSIQVDAEGNLTLRGSSDFKVLINSKPTILDGSDALKQIPAATIEKVEVITNPSAKYEADGTAGIINIILKKDNNDGFNGMISGNIGTGDKYSANTNFNFRKGKWNFFVGADYTDNTYHNSINYTAEQYFEDINYGIDYQNESKFFNDNAIIRGGIDFYMNEKNSFSIAGSVGERGFDKASVSRYSYTDNFGNKSYSLSDKFQDVYGFVTECNVDYTHTFGEEHNWITSLHYESWDGHNNENVTEDSTSANWNVIDQKSQFGYEQDEFNYLYRLNTDYKQPLGENGKIEAGYQLRFHERNDDLVYKNLDIAKNQWIENKEFTNIMFYQRYIHSAYTMYAGSYSGFTYQFGLRAEYTDRNIEMSLEDIPHQYDYLALFPSVHISKEFKNKHQLQISYSRRTRRPHAWLLNGTPSYMDPNNVFKGNPDVVPEYTNSYEVNYRKVFEKTTVSLQTYYRNTLNSFTQIRTLDENGITTHNFANADEDRSMGVEAGFNLNLFKWWQVNLNTNFYNYEIEGQFGEKDTTARNITWDANISSMFSFKWGTRIQLNGYYSAPSVDLQGERNAVGVVSLAINQSFLKGRATIGIVCRDLFNSVDLEYHAVTENYRTDYFINPEQVFMLNFSYNFNNYRHKQRGAQDQTDFGGNSGF